MNTTLTQHEIRFVQELKRQGYNKDESLRALELMRQKQNSLNQTVTEERPAPRDKKEKEKEGVRGGAGVVVGAGKAALRTVGSATELMGNIFNLGLKALGAEKVPENDWVSESLQHSEIFQSHGFAEKAGSVGFEVGTYAAPATKVAKAGKAVGVAETLVKRFPKMSSLAKRSPKTLNFMAKEMVTTAPIAAIHEGEFNDNVLNTVIASSALPMFGAALKKISTMTGKARDKFAEKLVNSMIKPRKIDFAYGSNPGRAIAQEGIIAGDFDTMLTKINSSLDDKFGKLTSLVQKSKNTVDTSAALKPISEALKTAQKARRTNAAIISRLTNMAEDIAENFQPGQMPALQAVSMKRYLGDLARYTGAPSDDKLVNKAIQKSYSNIKRKIEDAVPGTKKLNQRISDLLSAKSAVRHRDQIIKRQDMISFTGKTVGTAAAVGSAVAGGTGLGPLIAGSVTAGAVELLRQPISRTAMAKFISQSDDLVKKQIMESDNPLARVLKGAFYSQLNSN